MSNGKTSRKTNLPPQRPTIGLGAPGHPYPCGSVGFRPHEVADRAAEQSPIGRTVIKQLTPEQLRKMVLDASATGLQEQLLRHIVLSLLAAQVTALRDTLGAPDAVLADVLTHLARGCEPPKQSTAEEVDRDIEQALGGDCKLG